MTLIPTDSAVGIVAKLHQTSPEAAESLARIALFESFADQLEELRPHFELEVHKNLAESTAAARRAMLRTHVGKALEGQAEPDDVVYAASLAVLDEYVEKALSGWILNQFNRSHPRDEHGRFTQNPTQGAPEGGPKFTDRQHGRQQSAIDLASLTLGATQGQGNRLTRGIFDGQGNVKDGQSAADRWHAPTEGTDRQAYRRLQMTGAALAGASAPGSSANFVGNLTQLAGELGPQAEKVLGPGIRRTAYRYRGTERRPDRSVVASVDQANEYAVGLASDDEQARARAESAMATQYARDKGRNPAATIVNRWKNDRKLSPDQFTLLSRGDAAVSSFLAVDGTREESLLPNLDLVRLSLESGEMPPSQGVIIDAQGRVATQAIGYNGDHYLPFDLRNLGALQGGQYVRTRATGGLTTEDIYTGLLTGARQIQVVSNSGVFTMEFDPDFRGVRRYNDKAHRMIERYGSMLEAIQNKQIFEPGGDLPPEEMSRIRTEAARASRTQDEFNETRDRLLEEARMKASFSEVDMTELEEASREYGRTRAREEAKRAADSGQPMSQTQARQVAAEEAGRYRQENQPVVRRMKLDGVGYDNAMRALQQEFPYYVRRAQWQPLDAWLGQYDFSNRDLGYRRHAPSELGYVEPGQTNTKATRQGPGFRSARKVPTSYTRGGAAPAGGEGGEKAKEGEQPKQEQKQGEQRAAGTPAQQKQAAVEQAYTSLGRPESPLARQLTTQGQGIIKAAAAYNTQIPDPAVQWTDESIIQEFGPDGYVRWKTQKFPKNGTEGRTFFSWLATEATPEQVEAIREGIDVISHDIDAHPDDYAAVGMSASGEKVREQANELFEGYNLLHPFAEVPEGQDPNLIEPTATHARPPQMPGVPDITASPEDIQHAEDRMTVGNPKLAEIVERFNNLDDEEQRYEVADAYDNYATREEGQPEKDVFENLAYHQMAWSIVQAKRLSERLHKIPGLAGGGAAPLAKADRPRRRLIFG